MVDNVDNNTQVGVGAVVGATNGGGAVAVEGGVAESVTQLTQKYLNSPPTEITPQQNDLMNEYEIINETLKYLTYWNGTEYKKIASDISGTTPDHSGESFTFNKIALHAREGHNTSFNINSKNMGKTDSRNWASNANLKAMWNTEKNVKHCFKYMKFNEISNTFGLITKEGALDLYDDMYHTFISSYDIIHARFHQILDQRTTAETTAVSSGDVYYVEQPISEKAKILYSSVKAILNSNSNINPSVDGVDNLQDYMYELSDSKNKFGFIIHDKEFTNAFFGFTKNQTTQSSGELSANAGTGDQYTCIPENNQVSSIGGNLHSVAFNIYKTLFGFADPNDNSVSVSAFTRVSDVSNQDVNQIPAYNLIYEEIMNLVGKDLFDSGKLTGILNSWDSDKGIAAPEDGTTNPQRKILAETMGYTLSNMASDDDPTDDRTIITGILRKIMDKISSFVKKAVDKKKNMMHYKFGIPKSNIIQINRDNYNILVDSNSSIANFTNMDQEALSMYYDVHTKVDEIYVFAPACWTGGGTAKYDGFSNSANLSTLESEIDTQNKTDDGNNEPWSTPNTDRNIYVGPGIPLSKVIKQLQDKFCNVSATSSSNRTSRHISTDDYVNCIIEHQYLYNIIPNCNYMNVLDNELESIINVDKEIQIRADVIIHSGEKMDQFELISEFSKLESLIKLHTAAVSKFNTIGGKNGASNNRNISGRGLRPSGYELTAWVESGNTNAITLPLEWRGADQKIAPDGDVGLDEWIYNDSLWKTAGDTSKIVDSSGNSVCLGFAAKDGAVRKARRAMWSVAGASSPLCSKKNTDGLGLIEWIGTNMLGTVGSGDADTGINGKYNKKAGNIINGYDAKPLETILSKLTNLSRDTATGTINGKPIGGKQDRTHKDPIFLPNYFWDIDILSTKVENDDSEHDPITAPSKYYLEAQYDKKKGYTNLHSGGSIGGEPLSGAGVAVGKYLPKQSSSVQVNSHRYTFDADVLNNFRKAVLSIGGAVYENYDTFNMCGGDFYNSTPLPDGNPSPINNISTSENFVDLSTVYVQKGNYLARKMRNPASCVNKLISDIRNFQTDSASTNNGLRHFICKILPVISFSNCGTAIRGEAGLQKHYFQWRDRNLDILQFGRDSHTSRTDARNVGLSSTGGTVEIVPELQSTNNVYPFEINLESSSNMSMALTSGGTTIRPSADGRGTPSGNYVITREQYNKTPDMFDLSMVFPPAVPTDMFLMTKKTITITGFNTILYNIFKEGGPGRTGDYLGYQNSTLIQKLADNASPDKNFYMDNIQFTFLFRDYDYDPELYGNIDLGVGRNQSGNNIKFGGAPFLLGIDRSSSNIKIYPKELMMGEDTSTIKDQITKVQASLASKQNVKVAESTFGGNPHDVENTTYSNYEEKFKLVDINDAYSENSPNPIPDIPYGVKISTEYRFRTSLLNEWANILKPDEGTGDSSGLYPNDKQSKFNDAVLSAYNPLSADWSTIEFDTLYSMEVSRFINDIGNLENNGTLTFTLSYYGINGGAGADPTIINRFKKSILCLPEPSTALDISDGGAYTKSAITTYNPADQQWTPLPTGIGDNSYNLLSSSIPANNVETYQVAVKFNRHEETTNDQWKSAEVNFDRGWDPGLEDNEDNKENGYNKSPHQSLYLYADSIPDNQIITEITQWGNQDVCDNLLFGNMGDKSKSIIAAMVGDLKTKHSGFILNTIHNLLMSGSLLTFVQPSNLDAGSRISYKTTPNITSPFLIDRKWYDYVTSASATRLDANVELGFSPIHNSTFMKPENFDTVLDDSGQPSATVDPTSFDRKPWNYALPSEGAGPGQSYEQEEISFSTAPMGYIAPPRHIGTTQGKDAVYTAPSAQLGVVTSFGIYPKDRVNDEAGAATRYKECMIPDTTSGNSYFDAQKFLGRGTTGEFMAERSADLELFGPGVDGGYNTSHGHQTSTRLYMDKNNNTNNNVYVVSPSIDTVSADTYDVNMEGDTGLTPGFSEWRQQNKVIYGDMRDCIILIETSLPCDTLPQPHTTVVDNDQPPTSAKNTFVRPEAAAAADNTPAFSTSLPTCEINLEDVDRSFRTGFTKGETAELRMTNTKDILAFTACYIPDDPLSNDGVQNIIDNSSGTPTATGKYGFYLDIGSCFGLGTDITKSNTDTDPDPNISNDPMAQIRNSNGEIYGGAKLRYDALFTFINDYIKGLEHYHKSSWNKLTESKAKLS